MSAGPALDATPETIGAAAADQNSAAGSSSAQTRERLIEAAGQVFAERGFRQATIRQICNRAGANIAAVNYHFGGKRHLYAAVLRDAHRRSHDEFPIFLDTDPTDPPEERLRAFIRSFLLRMLAPGRPAWHGRLMIREMADPTPALDELVRDSITGHFADLGQVLHELMGPQASLESVRLHAMSIVAQCLFYRMARPVIERLVPGRYGSDEVEALAQHITAFSLAGIRASDDTKGDAGGASGASKMDIGSARHRSDQP
ncbi:MAG: CerR family C-terminal domain-containing protein [Phycisphaerales bacterium]|nr:CerR family C-terminal domain-containing protein [Phycisphaerales bacterium]